MIRQIGGPEASGAGFCSSEAETSETRSETFFEQDDCGALITARKGKTSGICWIERCCLRVFVCVRMVQVCKCFNKEHVPRSFQLRRSAHLTRIVALCNSYSSTNQSPQSRSKYVSMASPNSSTALVARSSWTTRDRWTSATPFPK